MGMNVAAPPCSNEQGGAATSILYEMSFNLKLSGNEVYYTIFKILLVKTMLCSELHYQKDFRLKHLLYKIVSVGCTSLLREVDRHNRWSQQPPDKPGKEVKFRV